MGTRNDDISLKLAKAVKQGFLPDVSDAEVDILAEEAKLLFKMDEAFGSSLANQLQLRKLRSSSRKFSNYPTVMSAPPTITHNAASTIASNRKTWKLTPPVNPSANGGPANIYGSITFGTTNLSNSGKAGLYADAKPGDTTIQLKATPGGGALATGSYRIDLPTAVQTWTPSLTAEELLAGEDITITQVTGGAAPYTATLSAPLKKAHRVDTSVNAMLVDSGYNSTYYISSVGAWNGITGGITVETITDAPILEILCRHYGSGYRLWVDGEVVTAGVTAFLSGGGGQPPTNGSGYLSIDFGSRKVRRIKFEASTMEPTALFTTNADFVTAPENPLTRVLWIGDSFLGQAPYEDSIAQLASRQLGWDNVIVDQIGGTGYVAINTTYSTINQRLNTHIAAKPDVIVICSSLNDAWTPELQGIIEKTLKDLRAGNPQAPMFVVGPWSHGNSSNSNKQTVAQAVRNATKVVSNTYFIDTMLGEQPGMNPWVVGTGKVGATTNDGNADVVVSSDAVHPSPYGKVYYAARIATAIESLI